MKRIRQPLEANWHEPILMQMGTEGERGTFVDDAGDVIRHAVGDVCGALPAGMSRTEAPALPQLSQPQIVRHYLRLSQMTLGQAVTPDMSHGTCTMKYSPLVNERLCADDRMTDMHPLQDTDTMQGTLEIHYRLQELLKEISGLDVVSLQPSSGSQAVYVNACLIRAYHESRGESHRDEIITTAFSHPVNGAAPHTAGYKVITLYPDDETAYPSVESLKAVLSDRTAGLMLTNPEDTGIYNPHMAEFVRLVHEAGGVCAYDQANANGVLGVARALETGFDLCHFNLHKTFGSPHGSFGPGCGAVCAKAAFEPFLPAPVVTCRDGVYGLDYDRPQSIGKVRSFLGNVQVMLRTYAWIMALGADGLRKAAELSVLNNNYLTKKLLEVRGLDLAYPQAKSRLEQTRFTWNQLFEETGVRSVDIRRRMVDYGLQGFHMSHHPVLVPHPCTLEPTESYSKADMDYYVDVFHEISNDAYSNPELIINGPEHGMTSVLNDAFCSDENTRAMTWRAYVRKNGDQI